MHFLLLLANKSNHNTFSIYTIYTNSNICISF